MPVLKKQFDIGSKKIWVRQASGMERLQFETLLAKTFRSFRHFGTDQISWTEDQQEEFMIALEAAGGGMEMRTLVPPCLMDDVDINLIDRDLLMEVYEFIRGGEPEGAVPLDS